MHASERKPPVPQAQAQALRANLLELGIAPRSNDEIGEIVVADVNTHTIRSVLQPDSERSAPHHPRLIDSEVDDLGTALARVVRWTYLDASEERPIAEGRGEGHGHGVV